MPQEEREAAKGMANNAGQERADEFGVDYDDDDRKVWDDGVGGVV